MLLKTFQNGFRFVLVLGVLLPTTTNLWSKPPARGKGDVAEDARVTISVYNDAGAPSDVLGGAEEQAAWVFRQAGIAVTWLNCKAPAASEEASQACRQTVFPEHLHLRIVPTSFGVKGDTLGIAFQAADGSGCYADLFYNPMEQLHRTDGTDIAHLLGFVAAHEIGHLLLGRNSHSPSGIMHAHWTADELATAKSGGLLFSERESHQMKARLATAPQASKEGPSTMASLVLARTGD